MVSSLVTMTRLARPSILYPRVMAGAVAAAVRVAGRHWISPGATGSFADVLRRALTCILPAAQAQEDS
nr:hypothetical protein [Thermomonospora curvata]